MAYKLNGINYTEMLLTDEELAVVKAMRKPVTMVNVRINFETEEEAEKYASSFPNRKDYLDSQGEDFFYSSTLKTSIYANYEKSLTKDTSQS